MISCPVISDAYLVEVQLLRTFVTVARLAEIRRHAGTDGFKPLFRYTGSDVLTLIRLASAGHGLTLLPETVLPPADVTAAGVSVPKMTHRTELIHGTLRESSPAAELAALVSTPRLLTTEGQLALHKAAIGRPDDANWS
jgi:DNA-binding transcriptional LysR family regulator